MRTRDNRGSVPSQLTKEQQTLALAIPVVVFGGLGALALLEWGFESGWLGSLINYLVGLATAITVLGSLMISLMNLHSKLSGVSSRSTPLGIDGAIEWGARKLYQVPQPL